MLCLVDDYLLDGFQSTEWWVCFAVSRLYNALNTTGEVQFVTSFPTVIFSISSWFFLIFWFVSAVLVIELNHAVTFELFQNWTSNILIQTFNVFFNFHITVVCCSDFVIVSQLYIHIQQQLFNGPLSEITMYPRQPSRAGTKTVSNINPIYDPHCPRIR